MDRIQSVGMQLHQFQPGGGMARFVKTLRRVRIAADDAHDCNQCQA
jgi:hypothetical protein